MRLTVASYEANVEAVVQASLRMHAAIEMAEFDRARLECTQLATALDLLNMFANALADKEELT